tara:strand:+ start:257 stop:589 length:333 start_codon:yes stop_codon:yes gene_type:complete
MYNLIKETLSLIVYFIVFLWLVGVGLHLTMQKAKASDYATATGAHIITQTVKGNIDHKAVMTSEIEKMAHTMAIEMTFVLQKHLPNILESIAADIRVNGIDKVYKDKQTK